MAKVTVVKTSQFSTRVVDTRRYATARLGEGLLDRACDCQGRTGCKSASGCGGGGVHGEISRSPRVSATRMDVGLQRVVPRGGGLLCDIPPWVVDCIRQCIEAFNAEFPPLDGDLAIPGVLMASPLEYGQQLQRADLFIGRAGTGSVLAYASRLCGRSTVTQLEAIATAYGGPGDFEGFVGQATGINVTISYFRSRGRGLEPVADAVSVFVPGVNLGSVPTNYPATTCGTPPGLDPRPLPRRTWRWRGPQQLLAEKYNFPGSLASSLCDIRRITPFEEDLFRQAYERAQEAVPTRNFFTDDASRLSADRAWADAFWDSDDPNFAGLDSRVFGFQDLLEFSRGPHKGLGGNPYSAGRLPSSAIMFGNWLLLRQCPWHPAP